MMSDEAEQQVRPDGPACPHCDADSDQSGVRLVRSGVGWHCERCLLDWATCTGEGCGELTPTGGRFCPACGEPVRTQADRLPEPLTRLRRLRHAPLSGRVRRVLKGGHMVRFPICTVREAESAEAAGTFLRMIPPLEEAPGAAVTLGSAVARFDPGAVNDYELIVTSRRSAWLVNVIYEAARELPIAHENEHLVQQVACTADGLGWPDRMPPQGRPTEALLALTARERQLARAVIVPCEVAACAVRPELEATTEIALPEQPTSYVWRPLHAGDGQWLVFFTDADGALMLLSIDCRHERAQVVPVLSAESGKVTCTRGSGIIGTPWVGRVDEAWLHVGLVAHVTSVLDRGWKQMRISVTPDKAIVRRMDAVGAGNISRVRPRPDGELMIAGDLAGGETVKDFVRLGPNRFLTLYTRNNIDYLGVDGREFQLPGKGETVDVWGRYVILSSYQERERRMVSIYGEGG